MRGLGAQDSKVNQNYEVVPFAQLLGKIAWSMAAADRRLDRLTPNHSVLRALTSEPNDIGRWVGTFTDPPTRQPGLLHSIVPLEKDDYLMYQIQLFADAQTPRYAVVVGRLR